MAIKTFKYFDAGVGFKDQASDTITTNGVIYRNGNSLKLYIQNALRNIVTDTQTQTLTNKTIDAASNTVSNIATANLAAGVLNTSTTLASASNTQVPSALAVKSYVDAGLALQNDASEIAFAPNGDITSTNVQAAIVEVRDDTDTKLTFKVDKTTTVNGQPLSANVILAKADVGLGNVDNTSDATKNAATANLTNKSLVSPNRIDAKKDTKANLISYAFTTGQNGEICWATDLKEYYGIKDGVLIPLGGGSSSLGTILQLTASEQISDWSTGDNATFLGGGTLSGTFAFETSTPLHGAASYKYTQAAGSLNDYLASPVFAVDSRFRGQQVFLSFPYKYDGATNDIQIVIYDVTNSAIISSVTDVVFGTNGGLSGIIASCLIPTTCTSIRIGFHVKVLNSGKIFHFDDVTLSTDLFGNINTNVVEAIEALTATTTFGSTNTGVPVLNITRNTNLGVIRIDSSAANGTSFVALKDCELKISANFIASTTAGGYITRNATVLTATTPNGIINQTTIAGTQAGSLSAVIKAIAGDVIRIQRNATSIATADSLTLTATADNNATASPTQQVSSDTMSFAFKATAIDPNVDPIGTFNTYTYASSTNTATIAGTSPTQTTSSMNVNGIQIFARAYNATSTSASPTRVDIFIGKELKSTQVSAYASLAKAAGSEIVYDKFHYTSNAISGTEVSYNSTTGILSINAGKDLSNAGTSRIVGENYSNSASSGYFTINASKTPSLVTIPNLQQRVAYIKDVKASGTAGGTFTAGAYVTRTLNTTEDPTGIITSLASNQFVLSAGIYDFEISAPRYLVNVSKVKLRNITDSSDALIGTNSDSGVSAVDFARGQVTITSAKTFEVQHRCGTTRAGDGLGGAATYGESEVYTQVKITRIK